MSMYELFKTDSALETEGVVINYGSFRVTLARAGGSNKKFARVLEAKTKPYKRAIDTGTMDNDRGLELLREVYAEAVILNWETKQQGKYVQGIESPDGELLPFTKENVLAVFNELPDLFMDLQEQANKAAVFRQSLREEAAGN
jgi:hypothetical protein